MRAAAVFAVLLWFAWPGARAYFDDDDIMNLRNSLGQPAGTLLTQTLTFSPESYRPVGLLWYKTMLACAGLNPTPYRAVSFAVLILNLLLLYRVTLPLTGSVDTALLAALIGCYHSRMIDLYFSSSSVYDLLCYSFYFAAFLMYMRSRGGVASICTILLFQVLALGAKEMAVTLPAVLMVYELTYRRAWKTRGICLAASFAISAIFCLRKVLGGTQLEEAYHPVYSLGWATWNWRRYLGLMLYDNNTLPPAIFALILLVPLAAALWLRSKPLAIACALIFIAPLPVLFVHLRGLSMLYISMTGWALFLACVLTATRGPQAVLFPTVAILLCLAHYRDRPDHTFPTGGREEQIRPFLESVKHLQLSPQPGTLILLQDDPFPPDQWFASMILQLQYRQPGLEVLRAKLPEQRAAAAERRPDVVLTWKENRLERIVP